MNGGITGGYRRCVGHNNDVKGTMYVVELSLLQPTEVAAMATTAAIMRSISVPYLPEPCPTHSLCTLILLLLPFRLSSFLSTANLAPLAARCAPVLLIRESAKDGERKPMADTGMLGHLDQPERYGVNLVAS